MLWDGPIVLLAACQGVNDLDRPFRIDMKTIEDNFAFFIDDYLPWSTT